MRRQVVLLVTLAAVAVGILFGAASLGNAASPDITFTFECDPTFITGTAANNELGCDGRIVNNGPQTATQIQVSLTVPGATLVVAESDLEPGMTCTAAGTCTLSNLQAGDVAEFKAIFDNVVAGNIFASLSFHEGATEGDVGKQDTVCANGGGAPPCPAVDSVATVAPGDRDDKAGDYVAFVENQTDTLATTGLSTIVGEVITQVKIPFRASFPFGFGATIVDAPADTVCPANAPAGTTCFGQSVTTTQFPGQFLTTDPVIVTFQLIAPKGKNDKTILVLHNGVPSADCNTSPLSATVDTCVRRDLGSTTGGAVKTATLVVETTKNGGWDFG